MMIIVIVIKGFFIRVTNSSYRDEGNAQICVIFFGVLILSMEMTRLEVEIFLVVVVEFFYRSFGGLVFLGYSNDVSGVFTKGTLLFFHGS